LFTTGNKPDYPVMLSLKQVGSDDLTLTPSATPPQVSGVGWSNSVLVTVSISDSVATDPLLNEDGDVLVAKLQLVADSPHLKTPTDILVKIKLVHPTTCLKVYDFITDASLANIITSTEVNVNIKSKVTSTNPYGSLSQNVMVANTCATSESFDLRVYLDSWFSTQPTNNPGNAVFTFATAGEIDASTFNIASFGLGTAQGQNLCLKNVTVPAGSTFLATVHTNINNGSAASSLPANRIFSGFSANLTTAGSSCGGFLISATPNPALAPLSFSIKSRFVLPAWGACAAGPRRPQSLLDKHGDISYRVFFVVAPDGLAIASASDWREKRALRGISGRIAVLGAAIVCSVLRGAPGCAQPSGSSSLS
jgi:hypothetical protein